MSKAYSILGMIDVLDESGDNSYPILLDPGSGEFLTRYFDEILLTSIELLSVQSGSVELQTASMSINCASVWQSAGYNTVCCVAGNLLAFKVNALAVDWRSVLDVKARRLVSFLYLLNEKKDLRKLQFLYVVE